MSTSTETLSIHYQAPARRPRETLATLEVVPRGWSDWGLCRVRRVAAGGNPSGCEGTRWGYRRGPRRSSPLVAHLGPPNRIQSAQMRIVWAPRALAHLEALRDYIAQDRPVSAASVAARILESVELLSPSGDWPARSRNGHAGACHIRRALHICVTAQIAPYRLRRDRLELIAVFHGRQKWPKKL